MNTATETEQLTVKGINEYLSDAGFDVMLAREDAMKVLQVEKRSTFVNALRRARGDSGARTYLQKLFARLGVGRPVQEQGTTTPTTGADRASESDAGEGNWTPPSEAQAAVDEGRQGRKSVHVYAQKAALCFEADKTRAEVPTVALDAAVSVGTRQYDWKGKVRIQMTERELPVVAAVLMGYLPRCEFNAHGPANDKGFSMECQPGKVFVRVMAKDQGVKAVPVEAADVWKVLGLVLEQLKAANPGHDTEMINMRLQGMARLVRAA